MADVSASTDSADQIQVAPPPSLRAVLMRHKRASVAGLLVVLAFLAILVPEVVSAGTVKITDGTSCTQWSSARPNQQDAYARLYLRLHRSLANGSTSVARVLGAVNYGCIEAFSYDESDSITVLQAIRGEY